MITVKRIFDHRVVAAVLEELADVITDDAGIPDAIEVPFTEEARWYATYSGDDLVSLWFAHKLNHLTWQVHTHFRKQYWGKDLSTPHGQAAIKKIWTNTGAKKLYASVPEYAEPVLALAKRLGFKNEGRMKRSWQKNGQVYDQIHIGVYR